MPDLQGFVSFTGVDQIVSARFQFGHGIEPAVAILDIAPQPNAFFSGGTLQFLFGDTQLSFPDCKVQRVAYRQTSQGQICRLRIVDRRWRWAFGQVSGSYNLRHDDNSLVASTERTPAQLAQLCLDALGESGADLSALSATPRPTVEWDYHNPAQALAELAHQCNCQVLLGLDNRVSLQPLASGQPLSLADDAVQYGLGGLVPVVPAQIVVATGRLRIQADFPLEAVGLDIDGETRPIDQLSYCPYGGWSTVDLEHFQAIADPRARELARSSVFRWYRIATPIQLPGQGSVADLGLILPIEADQVETTLAADGTARNRPAIIFGVWADYANQAKNRADRLAPLPSLAQQPDPRSIVITPFALDRDRALVKFAAPVIQYVEGPRPAAATLALRTAVGLRHPATRAWTRFERSRRLGDDGSSTEYLDRSDLIPTTVAQYDPGSYTLIGAIDNFNQINAQADATLDLAAARLFDRRPQQVVYAGLKAIEPKAGIDAVVWSIGPGGTLTEVYRHDPRRNRHGRKPSAGRSSSGQPRIDTQNARRQLKHLTVA